ncbi:hypothetical protein N9901_00400 [Flavobacteriaceae bacterium]|nr:hypothetical protein [Flavobacteriaceae bacterium]
MKIILLALVIIIAIVAYNLQSNKQTKALKSGLTTTGTVTEIFYRGKLPYCKFSYQVNGKTYKSNQSIPKNTKKSIVGKSYTVNYEEANNNNAVINLKEAK